MSQALEKALEYASRRWPVLPVASGRKAPLTAHGVKDATTDEATIRDWFTRWPSANIGIETGEGSGLLVFDVDPRNGGEASFSEVCSEEPETFTVRTGGGGRHLYFRYPAGRVIKNQTNMRPGLDLKSSGGYVVAPPSELQNGGRYELIRDGSVAPVPEWLETLLEEATSAKRDATRVSLPEGEAIPEGARNATLAQIAGALRRYGASAGTILVSLRAENERCEPRLEDDKVRSIAESIARYRPEADTYACTDSGNAERFVAQHGENVRYVFDWSKWLVWDGVRWKPDETGEVYELALDTIRGIYQAAGKTADKERRSALVKHASASESASKLKAMLELARPKVPTLIRELDKDELLLGVRNGTLDLRTGELREPKRSDLITKAAAVTYDAEASCTRWLEFLEEIFADYSVVRFLQAAVGYSLTADTSEQVVFVCYGHGANGKSTFIGAVQRLLGDYALSTPPDTISQNKSSGIPNDLARLRGMRYTSLLEFEEGRRINEPLLKALTGGDQIAARFLHAEYFDLQVQAKFWLGTNHKPRILGQDNAVWRRIRLIPFEVQIPEEKRDNALPKTLDEERSGILNWALEGLRIWHEEGLLQPVAVASATSEFRSESDVLLEFFEECIEHDEGFQLPSSALFEMYKKWAEANGERAYSNRWLTLRLEERGYIRKKTKRENVWLDIAEKRAGGA